MKNTALFLLILLVILLAACRDDTPEAMVAPEPTAAATDMPVEEASPEAQEATEAPEPTIVPSEEASPAPTEADTVTESAAEGEPTPEAAEAGGAAKTISAEQLELMAAIAPPPQLSEREPGIETVPCFPGIRLGGVEGEDYTCGVFTVPQNWDDPDGRNLDLAFVVVKATGENPEPDPLLHLTGGPGPSAILAIGVTKYQKLRPARDIIFYDIRGTGFSPRLGFQECLVLALRNGAPAEQIEALQVAAPDLVGAASGDEILAPPAAWDLDHPTLNGICAEQFAAQGLDLNHFSTADHARDAVELIKALGYESFNIHGESYGTRQAMTIMDDIPGYNDVPELRSVVLDSTFPPSVYLIRTMVRSDHDFMLQLLDECEADPACNEAYPNLKERLAALLDKLEEEPLTASGETVTIDDVVGELQPGGTRAAYLPKMIAELEMGILDTYLALRDEQIGTAPAEPEPPFEWDTSDPVQAFISNSMDLLGGEDALELKVYVDSVLVQEDPLANLQEIIQQVPGETGEQMQEMLGKLTPEDIASSPYVAQLPRIEIPGEGESDPESQLAEVRERIAGPFAELAYTTIHCIDDILHESFEDASNIYNNLQFPQLTDLEETQVQAGRCENWPVNAAPIEVKGPVTSNVPALILQGAYDQPTPVYMGQTAARELENSTYILIPQQRHGTWTNAGSCVGQIATVFVQDPEAALDLSCLDARRPQWALPGDDGS